MPAFRISDMTCDGCIRALTAAVKDVDAAADLRADLGAGTVQVSSTADTHALAEAMRDAGFTVTPA